VESVSLVVSVLEMVSRLGYTVPSFNVRYDEIDTRKSWLITCGGSRCYLSRVVPAERPDLDEEAADSHFMINRVIAALLISGAGLFNAQVKGRLIFYGADPIHWDSIVDFEPFYAGEIKRVHQSFSIENFTGWLKAIYSHRFIYRAAEDLVLALRTPAEAFVFIYRGFEWIEDGIKVSKRELAEGIGVRFDNLKELGKIANVGTGARHATDTGVKMRANFENYSTWIAGLVDAINFARTRVEPGFTPMKPEEVAEALTAAITIRPYAY
jgi:hypothetical protein